MITDLNVEITTSLFHLVYFISFHFYVTAKAGGLSPQIAVSRILELETRLCSCQRNVALSHDVYPRPEDRSIAPAQPRTRAQIQET